VRGRAVRSQGGKAAAALLARRGAQVFVTGRDPEKLARCLEELPGLSGEAHDLAQPGSADSLAASFGKHHGGLDILVLDAGITPWQGLGGWDEETFDGLFATNVRGPWLLIDRLAALLRSDAAIVAVSSIAALKSTPITAA
jgi:NAD(P)-dependent dehydrogenase (short-subunit alcohol dehydrogenase family)